nr:RNA polymerase sigma-54 factor [Rhizobiaceae bacterium]
MALAQRLDIKLGQSLVMTPQLLQSIRLLQLTHAELSQFIAEEIERNPFLEMTGAAGEASGEPQPSAPAEMRAEAGDWVAPELSAETSAES